MKRTRVAFAAALLLAAPECWAQAGRVDSSKAVTTDAIGAQASGYGQWLQRLTEAQMVGLTELQTLGEKWRSISQTLTPAAIQGFRTEIAKARAAILRSDALLNALDRPAFPLLELAPDLQPDAMIRQMLETSAKALDLVDSFGPMLDAMAARDEKAVEGAAVKLLGAARLLVQSQALIGSAMLTTIDRDAAQYEATQFDVLLYRTASVLLDAAGTVMRGGAQPQFGADMERIASEIDALVTSGSAKAEASIADEKATLKETRDPAVALLIRKALEIDELERRSFAVAREFAAALRALPKGPVGFGQIEQSLNALRIARAAMDEITLAQNAVLARDH